MRCHLLRETTLAALAVAALSAVAVPSHWNGGRNVPVHKIALLDSDGDTVSPRESDPRAPSTVKTCGQCHDLAAMKGGSHFRTGLDKDEAKQSVTVEPWFMIDRTTGTQLPLSLRSQGGAYHPQQIGMGYWEWTRDFGRHFPGGGIASDERRTSEKSGSLNRWYVTGPLEPNCFACHANTAEYDHSEWARQIIRENFSGAMSAALGLADVEGMNSRLPSFWSPMRGANPDDRVFQVPQEMHYDASKFDDKERTVLPVGRPRNENCLACHSVTEKGMAAHDIQGDVHLRAGLSCTDCHTCGIDHRIKTTSCAECHTKGDSKGKLRGPRPKHTGFPIVHFEKLSCTVCHSGVTKGGRLAEVRTSRANRIGIYGKAQWATDAPYILEPVFSKDLDGKIRPNRVMWPAFFAKIGESGSLEPIRPETAAELAGDALTPVQRVKAALDALNSNPNRPGDAVLTEEGLFFRTKDGDLPLWTEDVPEKDPEALAKVNKKLCDVLQSIATILPEKCRDIPVAFRRGKPESYFFEYREIHPRRDKDGGDLGLHVKNDFKSVPAEGDLMIGFFKDGKDEFVPLFDKYTRAQYLSLKDDKEHPLTEDMVKAALVRMGEDYRYVAQGCIFGVKDGKLYHSTGDIAAPIAWPVGHDVRPAGQALGSAPQRCAECHTADSSFFFGSILPTGPIAGFADLGAAVDKSAAMGLSGFYHRVFGFTFIMRPFFKVFLWVVFALACIFAAAAAAVAVPAALRGIRGKAADWRIVRVLLVLLLASSVAYLGFSGAMGWLWGGMTGWLLVFHMVAGGAFAFASILLFALRGGEHAASHPWLYLALAVFGAGTIFTAVMPMMTVFGDAGQRFLLASHRCCAFCCALVLALLCAAAWKGRGNKAGSKA